MSLDIYRIMSEAAVSNDNASLRPYDRAAGLISEILTQAWPSTQPGAMAYQLGYLKGLLAEIAAYDPDTMDRLERHRDHVVANNQEFKL
jgi:hypothetical protein